MPTSFVPTVYWNRSLGTSKRAQGIATPKDENKSIARKGKAHAYKKMMEIAGIKEKNDKRKKGFLARAVNGAKKIVTSKKNAATK